MSDYRAGREREQTRVRSGEAKESKESAAPIGADADDASVWRVDGGGQTEGARAWPSVGSGGQTIGSRGSEDARCRSADAGIWPRRRRAARRAPGGRAPPPRTHRRVALMRGVDAGPGRAARVCYPELPGGVAGHQDTLCISERAQSDSIAPRRQTPADAAVLEAPAG